MYEVRAIHGPADESAAHNTPPEALATPDLFGHEMRVQFG